MTAARQGALPARWDQVLQVSSLASLLHGLSPITSSCTTSQTQSTAGLPMASSQHMQRHRVKKASKTLLPCFINGLCSVGGVLCSLWHLLGLEACSPAASLTVFHSLSFPSLDSSQQLSEDSSFSSGLSSSDLVKQALSQPDRESKSARQVRMI